MNTMKRRILIISLILCVLVNLPGCTFPEDTAQTPLEGMEVHYIDVGQGDATLILCEGQSLLIDGGDNTAEETVVEYLMNAGVTELDYVLSTHPHADHCGGLDAVAETFPIGTVYTPCLTYDTVTFADFTQAVTDHGIALTIPETGTTFSLGSAQCTLLGPDTSNLPEDVNDMSLILRVTYGDMAFLFTGDAEHNAETELLDTGWDVSCDVLKVGHHGSYTSTGYRLVYEADPEYAVISCGAGNDYGHPHEETLSRLEDAEVTTLRTDEMGTIVFFTDGSTLNYETTLNEKGN